MKRIWIIIGIILTLATASIAADPVEGPASCVHCGMNRAMFAQSRMIITYTDGSSTGTCSIYCIATDLKQARGKKVKSVQVADYNSKKLLDAKKATWVMGGNKQGVMTNVAKWAFATRSAADKFIKENGGRLAKFDNVLGISVKEQPADDHR